MRASKGREKLIFVLTSTKQIKYLRVPDEIIEQRALLTEWLSHLAMATKEENDAIIHSLRAMAKKVGEVLGPEGGSSAI